MPPPPPFPPHELEIRNGPILIGFTIDCLLFGLLIAQICIFIRGRKWHRDGALMRSLVYMLCCVELFRFIVVVQSVWGLLVQARHPGEVAASAPLAVALPSLVGFESAVVQIFFAWRIWTMRREDWPYWVAATLIVMIAMMQTAGSVALSKQLSAAVAQGHFADHGHSLFTSLWLAGSFACDLFIVIIMALILIDVRKEAMFRETEQLINYLLRLIIETGALTVVAAAVMLGLHLKYPRQSYCFGILYILGGLYTNIFLYLLNSREEQRGVANEISLHLVSEEPHFRHTVESRSTSQALDHDHDLTPQRRSSKE